MLLLVAGTRATSIAAGSATVGKSTLIKRYCESRFVQKYIPTIGIDYGVKPVRVLGHDLKVNFFDTSGADFDSPAVNPSRPTTHLWLISQPRRRRRISRNPHGILHHGASQRPSVENEVERLVPESEISCDCPDWFEGFSWCFGLTRRCCWCTM